MGFGRKVLAKIYSMFLIRQANLISVFPVFSSPILESLADSAKYLKHAYKKLPSTQMSWNLSWIHEYTFIQSRQKTLSKNLVCVKNYASLWNFMQLLAITCGPMFKIIRNQ